MPRIKITKQFKFEAAHFLPNYEGACNNLHGHSYLLEISLEGYPKENGSEMGMVMDFGRLKKIVNEEIIEKMDHHLLNDIPGLENPTAEKMVVWVWNILFEKLPDIVSVKLWETETSYVEYKGERI